MMAALVTSLVGGMIVVAVVIDLGALVAWLWRRAAR
jgi:hypothetical protein